MRLLDCASGTAQDLEGHDDSVHLCRFTPSGRLLFTAAHNEILVWEVTDPWAIARNIGRKARLWIAVCRARMAGTGFRTALFGIWVKSEKIQGGWGCGSDLESVKCGFDPQNHSLLHKTWHTGLFFTWRLFYCFYFVQFKEINTGIYYHYRFQFWKKKSDAR